MDDQGRAGAVAGEELVTLQIQLRWKHVERLRALAAREGATVEAVAVQVLEEQLDVGEADGEGSR